MINSDASVLLLVPSAGWTSWTCQTAPWLPPVDPRDRRPSGCSRLLERRAGRPLEQFDRPTIKRHQPKTVRHNTGDDYHGCLRVIQTVPVRAGCCTSRSTGSGEAWSPRRLTAARKGRGSHDTPDSLGDDPPWGKWQPAILWRCCSPGSSPGGGTRPGEPRVSCWCTSRTTPARRLAARSAPQREPRPTGRRGRPRRRRGHPDEVGDPQGPAPSAAAPSSTTPSSPPRRSSPSTSSSWSVTAATRSQAHLAEVAPKAATAVQDQQRGTGHAVDCALRDCRSSGTVVVTYGDVPLLTGETLRDAGRRRTSRPATPSRSSPRRSTTPLVRPGRPRRRRRGHRVVEQKDATRRRSARSARSTPASTPSTPRALRAGLARLDDRQPAGEHYLTDVVGRRGCRRSGRCARRPTTPGRWRASTTGCSSPRCTESSTGAPSSAGCSPA